MSNSDIFKQKGTQCIQNGDENDIIDKCEHLKRLAVGLRYFNARTQNEKKWIEFCLHSYGYNFLDDYCHLLSTHADKMEQIKNELITKYKFANCLIKDCK
eukprot:112040_1